MLFIKMLFKRLLVLAALYQLCRIVFLLFNHLYFPGLTPKGLLTIFYGSIRFDLSAIFYFNAVYILMFLLPFNFRFNRVYRGVAKGIFILVNGVCLIANLADVAYYPFTLRRTNASFFLEFKNDTNLLGATGKFIISFWYITLLVVAFIWLLNYLYNKIKMPARESYTTRMLWLDAALLPFVFLIWLGVARGSFIPKNRPINISYAGDYINRPNETNLVINTPFSVYSTWGNIKIPPVNYYSSLDEAAQYYQPIQSFTSNNYAYHPKNVVIIIVESLSREFVGALNKNAPNYRGYTPFLDSLINNGLAFKYAFASGKRSIEALPSVIASIPSHSEAYIITPYASNRINSLVSVLKKHGYYTTFFHGGHNGSMGFSAFMNIAGADQSFSKDDYNNDKDYDGTWGIFDDPFMQFWANKMNTFKQPFCSVIFTVTSHHPYKLPEQYKDVFKGGPMPIDATIQYTDMSIGHFFKTASKMPWYKNTVFVISADHAATFGYYDQYKNSAGAYAIPIIFFTPDSSLKGFRNDIIQQSDIFPTLVNYLGFNDTILAFGNSVLHHSTGHLVVNYYGGMYQGYYNDLMMEFDGARPRAVYKFKDDMKLEHNIIGQNPAQEAALEAMIKAYMQQYATRVRENKMVP